MLRELQVFIRLISLGLIGLGLFFVVFGVLFIRDARRANDWPTVRGKIKAVRIARDRLSGTALSEEGRESLRRYYPEITYVWSVDGQEYSGSRYRFGQPHTKYKKRDDAREAAKKFPVGGEIDVNYDPSAHVEAVLDAGISYAVFVPLTLGILLLALGGGLLKFEPQIKLAQASSQIEAER